MKHETIQEQMREVARQIKEITEREQARAYQFPMGKPVIIPKEQVKND
jgi:hypothetical protein